MSFLGLIGSLCGSLLGGGLSLLGQNAANKTSINLANTAYQRSSADMMAAGLNPAAMFGSGGPAGTPQVQNAMSGAGAAAKEAAGSASAILVANKTIEQLTSQIAKTNADRLNVMAGTPGVAADSAMKSMSTDAVKRIPASVRIPLVQAGYGADVMRNTGYPGSIGGAAVASAKSAGKAVAPALEAVSGLSGPAVNSAVSGVRMFKDIKKRWDAAPPFWEYIRQQNERIRTQEKYGKNSSTVFKSN